MHVTQPWVELLQAEGIDVNAAWNGHQSLTLFKAAVLLPQLILLDLLVPDLETFEAVVSLDQPGRGSLLAVLSRNPTHGAIP
jgi:CheY-like chemotaxis protein